eukprot:SAG31_NODE_16732_length_698_cov_0.941569_1_plen_157_part_00
MCRAGSILTVSLTPFRSLAYFEKLRTDMARTDTRSGICPAGSRSLEVLRWWFPVQIDQKADRCAGGASARHHHTSHEESVAGMLTAVSEELPDAPLFHTLHGLSKTLRATSMDMANMRNALLNAGYRLSNFHDEPLAVTGSVLLLQSVASMINVAS